MGITRQQWNEARSVAATERAQRVTKEWNAARARRFNLDLREALRAPPQTGRPQPFTNLQLACRAADQIKVQEILAQGVLLNTKGPFNWTALHVTAMAFASTAVGSKRATLNTIAQLLLDAGADVGARDAMGLTPMACSNGVVPPAIRTAAHAAFTPDPDNHGAGERQYRWID